MANFTPFRLIDKNEQRNFKVNFFGLDGLWFNKIYNRYVAPYKTVATTGYEGATLQERIIWGFRQRTKMPHAEYEAHAQRIIELLQQAFMAINKAAKKAALQAEAAGQMNFDAIKAKFDKIAYIEKCCKKFHKVHLVVKVNPDGSWQYDNSWEKLDNKEFYTVDEIKAVINKLVENRCAWYDQRKQLMLGIKAKAAAVEI